MIIFFVFLAVKKVFAAISGLLVTNRKRAGFVSGAEWHGKITTLMLYGMMILHVIWQDIPRWTSNIFYDRCVVMIVLFFALYVRRNIHMIRSKSKPAE